MLFSRINKTDPEKVFVVVKAGEALLAGRPVCYHWTGTDDGKIGWLCDAATDQPLTIGLADAAIASGTYGLVQCYGYRSDAQMIMASNAVTQCGAVMDVASGSSGHLYMLSSLGAAAAVFTPFTLALSASQTVTAGLITGGIFIRCM
jgi:hypothetical protein